MSEWQIRTSTYPLQNAWVKIRHDTCELPDGRIVEDYVVVEEQEVGSVFALTPDREVVLAEQYKHAIGKRVLELPGGLFNSPDADPLIESRREFLEETGYDAASYHYLGKMAQSPSRMTNSIYLYGALDAYPTGQQHLDETEDITVRLIPIDRALAMIASGEIHAVATVAGIYMGWQWLQNGASNSGG